MNKIILFSGGFDSTLTLLKEMKEENEVNGKLTLATIFHANTGTAKLYREIDAREAIIKVASEIYPNVTLDYLPIRVEVEVSESKYVSYGNNKGISQPLFWLTNIIPFLMDNDRVIISYLSTDNANTLYKKEILDFWNSALAFQHKDCDLELPLIHLTKSEVIQGIITLSSSTNLLDLCTSCESSEVATDPNCSCLPCHHLKMALIQVMLDMDAPEDVVLQVGNLLRSRFGLMISKEHVDDEYDNISILDIHHPDYKFNSETSDTAVKISEDLDTELEVPLEDKVDHLMRLINIQMKLSDQLMEIEQGKLPEGFSTTKLEAYLDYSKLMSEEALRFSKVLSNIARSQL